MCIDRLIQLKVIPKTLKLLYRMKDKRLKKKKTVD